MLPAGGRGAPLLLKSVPGRPAGEPSYLQELVATAWLIAVAGVALGLIIGILMRVAMFALRVASPGSTGLISDDGFVIGEVTVSGTYNLLNLGAALGVLGTAAYVAVRPLLIGPGWARCVTVGVTAMFLGGAAAIHADGVDFTMLDTDVAVALFLAVPLVSGLVTPAVVDAVWRKHDRWPRWLAAGVLVFPLATVVLAVQIVAVAALLPVQRALIGPLFDRSWRLWLARALFALVPLVALRALVADLAALP